jgi:hypothetical protein
MLDLEGILSLKRCDCCRAHCDFFAASSGEWGESYSKEYVEHLVRELPKAVDHLKRLREEK